MSKSQIYNLDQDLSLGRTELEIEPYGVRSPWLLGNNDKSM